MFYAILLVTLAVALVTSILVVRFFNEAVKKILSRIVGDDLAEAWRKYMSFAIVVVGVSGGVSTYEIQKYLQTGREQTIELTGPMGRSHNALVRCIETLPVHLHAA